MNGHVPIVITDMKQSFIGQMFMSQHREAIVTRRSIGGKCSRCGKCTIYWYKFLHDDNADADRWLISTCALKDRLQ